VDLIQERTNVLTKQSPRRKGFSLLELVIVVVIIGIIAAIAIPRLSRGTAGAADSALSGNLAVLRNAIDLYNSEHPGKFPTLAKIDLQLTRYTDAFESPGDRDGTHVYGPYIRKIPPAPVGPEKDKTGFTDTAGTTGKGWVYDEKTGEVKVNTTTEKDAAGKLYSDY
jgi:general secretion pathway protein G